MKRTILASFLLFVPVLAHAGDPLVPAREIIDVTVAGWAKDATETQDLFSDERLNRLYSKDFRDKYRAATKFPAFDNENGDTGSPFDYDVITSSQDGCPLEDVAVTLDGTKDGASDVKATFRLWGCSEDAEEKKTVTEVHFRVIEEGGRDVIDDIMTRGDGDAFESLKATMVSIVSQ